MIETIRDKIIELLEEVTDIVEVSKFAIQQPTGYPYAFVLYEGDQSEELTNKQDRVVYTFSIFLIQEKLEDFKGREEAEDTAINRAFTIAEKFRANNKLALADVMNVKPLKTERSYIEGGTRIQLKIPLEVETREDITF